MCGAGGKDGDKRLTPKSKDLQLILQYSEQHPHIDAKRMNRRLTV